MLANIGLGLSVPLKQVHLVLRLNMLEKFFNCLGNTPPSRVWITKRFLTGKRGRRPVYSDAAVHPRRRRLACRESPRRPRQPLPADLATRQPGTERSRGRLAKSARLLARDQRLRQLRGYCQRLCCTA